MKSRVLVVDDEKLIRWTLCETMSRAGHEVLEASDGLEALRLAESELPDAILLDLRMPEMDGLTVLAELAQRGLDAAVVVVTAQTDLETAVEAMRLGAEDFLKKPFDADEVEVVVARAIERRFAARELSRKREREQRTYTLARLVGEGSTTRRLRSMLARIAASDTRGILLSGEPGCGKGLVARILHFESPRRDAAFVRLTAVGPDEQALEREIFGFEKTALPGATTAGRGLVERATGGTLYLEEVADLPLVCQARLVDVIEDRVVRRVGGVRSLEVDVRVIAATSRDLRAHVEAGTFREDLYYRLSSIPLELLPLRERPEDLPALAASLMEELTTELARPPEQLSEAVITRLREHPWPGNIRELRNVLERALILVGDRPIAPDDLVPARAPEHAATSATAGKASPFAGLEGLTLEEVEKEMIRHALATTDGNQAKAARTLGISRDTLRYRIKKFGL